VPDADGQNSKGYECGWSVASELVINAIVHTEGRPVLELQVCADRVRIEVRDASPVLPVVGSHDARGA
jgi:hypothetical protein